MSAIIAAPPEAERPEPQEHRPDLRVIDFYLEREERRADWGFGVWVQIAAYGLMIAFVAVSFAASLFVLSLIRQ